MSILNAIMTLSVVYDHEGVTLAAPAIWPAADPYPVVTFPDQSVVPEVNVVTLPSPFSWHATTIADEFDVTAAVDPAPVADCILEMVPRAPENPIAPSVARDCDVVQLHDSVFAPVAGLAR
jgi:hypothetical protein